MKHPMILLLMLFNTSVMAQQDTKLRQDELELGIGLTANLLDEESGYQETYGAQLSLGYAISDDWLFETGISKLGETQAHITDNLFLRAKHKWRVSNYASVYVGGGASYFDEHIHPLLNLGINYKLTDKSYIDAGYQGLLATNGDSVYSLLLSFNYKFPLTRANRGSVNGYSGLGNSNVNNNDQYGRLENITPNNSIEQFYSYYTVVKGDTLTHISRDLGISLNKLVLANPQLAMKHQSIDLIFPGDKIFYPNISK